MTKKTNFGENAPISSVYLRPKKAAVYVGVSEGTLAKWRMKDYPFGDGPPFSRVGNRVVVYKRSDLDAWLENRRVCSE